MVKYTTIALILCSSTLTAQSKKSSSDFNTWLSEQYQALNNPVQFVCTQVCTQQYNSCLLRFRLDKKINKSVRSEQCTSLWLTCYTKCVQGLTTNTSSGGDSNSGGSSSGSSGGTSGGDIITPPDQDPTNDETNNPGDPTQPPVL